MKVSDSDYASFSSYSFSSTSNDRSASYFGDKSWIFYSLLGSVFFTACNLFLVELSKEGIYGYLFFCYGTLFASLTFFMHKKYFHKKDRDRAFKRSDLYFIDSDTGDYKWNVIWGLTIYSIIYLLGNILTILSFSFSINSHVNQGIIVSIYSMVPIWAAAVAYKLYSERLELNHWIGMLLLILCMTTISMSNGSNITTINDSEVLNFDTLWDKL
jgi:multidrug transporter EmrE-like cation transporter